MFLNYQQNLSKSPSSKSLLLPKKHQLQLLVIVMVKKGGNAANLGGTFWIPLSPEKLQSYNEKSSTMDSKEQPAFIIENVLELYNYFPKCSQVHHAGDITDSSSAMSHRRNSSHNLITSKSFKINRKRVSSVPEVEYYSENSSDTL